MEYFSSRRVFVILLSLLGIWLGLRYLLPIVTPFFFAGLLALLSEPLVKSLQKHLHLPRWLSAGIGVTAVLVLTVLLLLALCALLIRQLGTLAGVLPDLENATLSGLDSLESWLLGLVQNTPQGVRSILTHGVEGIFSDGSALLDSITSRILNLATALLKALPDSALGLGTWILATFMISARLPKLRAWLYSLIPPPWKEKCAYHLQTLKKTVLGWTLAQAKLVGITFLILCAGFFLLGIEHSVLWAGLTCFVDILPVLGTGTVLIPWGIVCFLRGERVAAIGLFALYAVVSLVRNVLEPRFVGKQLGLDPLITLLAIYAGYRLWGVGGMILAPLIAVAAVQLTEAKL